MIRDSGAMPVVLLTKPDLARDLHGLVKEAEDVAGGASVHVVSPLTGEGLESVRGQLAPAVTGALVGSSGVGKTTIINRLAGGTPRPTREVRAADSKGRHTTTHRELIPLEGGGLIIDTPGMRELQLWDAGDAMRQTFDDIEALAADCRFADCRHRDEPQCAVKTAVAGGTLPASRLESYLKLQEELDRLAKQQDERLQLDQRKTGRFRRPRK
jgi:ribosome biogenesis GTPase